jgi:quaternary ammonium compound-resistance protein SugE
MEGLMAWVYLLLAGVFEVIWASTMKHSDGFTKLTPTIITIILGLVGLKVSTP